MKVRVLFQHAFSACDSGFCSCTIPAIVPFPHGKGLEEVCTHRSQFQRAHFLCHPERSEGSRAPARKQPPQVSHTHSEPYGAGFVHTVFPATAGCLLFVGRAAVR
jgi:hypothetical protein